MSRKYITQTDLERGSKRQSVTWAVLGGYPTYKISDRALVVGDMKIDVVHHESQAKRYRIVSVRPVRRTSPYLIFEIYRPNRKSMLLHRARLEAFCGAGRSQEKYCLHRDGNSDNNDLENLYWGNHKENMQDVIKHGSQRGSNNPQAKLGECDAAAIYLLSNLGLIDSKLAAEIGVGWGTVHAIKTKNKWTHAITPYVEDLLSGSRKILEHKIQVAVERETRELKAFHAAESRQLKRNILEKFDELRKHIGQMDSRVR